MRKAAPLCLLLLACAPRAPVAPAPERLVADQGGVEIPAWDPSPAAISQPLTEEDAVALALRASPGLRAALAEVGVAEGMLRAARLPPNPEIEAQALWEGEGEAPELDVGLTLDVTGLLTVALRREVARADVSAARLGGAGAVVDRAVEVRVAWHTWRQAAGAAAVARSARDAAMAACALADRLAEAGNIPELDRVTQRAAHGEAQDRLQRAELAEAVARARLSALLGLPPDAPLIPPQALPAAPTLPGTAEEAVEVALASSLDLAGARAARSRADAERRLARVEGGVPHLGVGVAAERQEGTWATGPAVSLSVPLFDRGQGEVAAAAARAEVAALRAAEVEVAVRAAAAAAWRRAHTAAERVERYEGWILPARQEVAAQTLLQYNAMQVGIFQLLAARAELFAAREAYLGAIAERGIAAAELWGIEAGRLRMVGPPALQMDPTAPTAAAEDHP